MVACLLLKASLLLMPHCLLKCVCTCMGVSMNTCMSVSEKVSVRVCVFAKLSQTQVDRTEALNGVAMVRVPGLLDGRGRGC